MATSSELKRWGRQFIREVMNAHDCANLERWVHADIRLHDTVPDHADGIEGLRARFEEQWAAFPDIYATIDVEVAEDPMLVTRLTQTGTHTGNFRDVPASGNTVSYQEIHIVRIVDHLCVEHWDVINSGHLLQQIGAIPDELPHPMYHDEEVAGVWWRAVLGRSASHRRSRRA
jgi:predicted ester cyclase